jgi:hypothetical protein
VAQRYGCLNIRVNVKRCEDLLAMAKAKGIEPKTHLTK